MALNTYADISSIAPDIQDDAIFVLRETATMQNLVRTFNDARGGNPRKGYQYPQASAVAVGESDDLVSVAWTATLDQTLTPAEIGRQFFVTDLRADSESPENIRTDGGLELGLAARDKVETDLLSDLASLTGGTIGAAGTVITWGYVAATIAQAQNANKSMSVPLACVLHGYQWSVLAKSASVAGASLAQAPGFTEEMTRRGLVSAFMGVPIYQVFAAVDGNGDFTGGVFPRDAIALDWRRPVRVEPERDASRRGTEFNMSAVYAHGIWRPTRGVQMIFDAAAPTS